MTIEPHNVVTVSRRALPQLGATPDDYAKAATAYEANLRARFGKVPSWEDLAMRENRAMRASFGISPMARACGSHTVSEAQREKLRAASHARGIRTMNAILASLTQPMTREDLISITGIAQNTVQRGLNRALDEGLVRKTKAKTYVIWERVDTALSASVIAMNTAKMENAASRAERVAAFVTEPHTSREVATHLRVSLETAQTYLTKLRQQSRVINYRSGRQILWHRVQEAAE